MAYTLDRKLTGETLADIETRTRAALAANGFGVLTEIDVQATMKKKIDVNMPGYLILGACNPAMAYQAMAMEPKVGAMLPCNVILREIEGGIEVSAIDPVASMTGIPNDDLKRVARHVRQMLAEVLGSI
jgi:uncharacterized protein (DUF302 family)